MGIPDHFTCLLRNLYAGQEATVRTLHRTDWFKIGKGVCQSCISGARTWGFLSGADLDLGVFLRSPRRSQSSSRGEACMWLSRGFPRQEYWSGLPFPSSGDLPDPEIKPMSPALAGGFFTNEPPGKPIRDTKLYRGSKTHHHPSDLKIFSLSGYTPSHLAGGLCSRKALGTQLVAPGRGRGEEL